MSRHEKAVQAVQTIREAVQVRSQITELYRQYGAVCNVVTFATAEVTRADLKRAVDALYYLGGGWPSENSKGRMEALLDNFVGMYRILDFIDRGHHVTEHLAQYGITIKLADEFKIQNVELTPNDLKALNREYTWSAITCGIEPKTLKDLMSIAIMGCEDLQAEICKLADEAKAMNEGAQALLDVQDAEYDRLHLLVKLEASDKPRAKDTIHEKKTAIHASVHHFNEALQYTRTQN
jgi:hypothetical protein